ncbi:MAG TPA: NADH-quinone oxidoreductase subunit J [Planctomycetaceae bacterium]|nr:NADH-quinone oxidoreductase subunit J [Planctomycetaceae bacterium]HQZ63855.1 NADH-quinone oxidoreductase subunit J [Planctomycetaceae bacterium]
MNSESFLFTVFALATCLSALAVVFSQTVVRMAFWLIISLGSTAALFFLAKADFVGAAQLLVYVGGTLVLLVFGVMLTASGPYLKIKTSPGEIVMGGLVGLLFLFVVFASLNGVKWRAPTQGVSAVGDPVVATGDTLRPLALSFLGSRPDKDLSGDGDVLSPGYLLPFEIVSVHLLVVLIGAAYLARAKRRVATSGAAE